MRYYFPCNSDKPGRLGQLEPLIRDKLPDLQELLGSANSTVTEGSAIVLGIDRELNEEEQLAIQAVIDNYDATPGPDDLTAALQLPANLLAAHNEILWATVNNQPLPSWATAIVDKAHYLIDEARQTD